MSSNLDEFSEYDQRLVADVEAAFIESPDTTIRARIEMAAFAISTQIAEIDAIKRENMHLFLNGPIVEDMLRGIANSGWSTPSFPPLELEPRLIEHHDEPRGVYDDNVTPTSDPNVLLKTALDGIRSSFRLTRRQAQKAVRISRKIS